MRPQYVVGEGAGTGLIPLERTGATNRTVVVDYILTPGTAVLDVDYQTTNGVITFAPGEVLKQIPVPILEDALVEQDETFRISLVGSSGGVPLGGQSETTVVIRDNDTAFDFEATTFAAAENATDALLQVRRYGVVSNAVSVTLLTTNGTASDGDYVGTNVVLNFAAGETSQTLALRIIDDVLTESNETVLLSLSNPSAGTQLGATNTAVLTIVEDECAVEFTAATYQVKEYLGQVTLNVHRLGGTVNTVTVNYTTMFGTR
jgi:hypothetical protein